MATKSKLETAQSAKPKRAPTTASTSPATDGKRTAGAVTRSSSSSNVGKTPGATVSNVPSYLRPTQSTRTESPRSGGRKETPATKQSPALTRGQSVDKSAQLQRVLFSAGPRSPALKTPSSAASSPRSASTRPTELSKSLSSSSRSRTASARPAELVKSNTMPKPAASSRPGSASGSLSRLGSTTGKTVKKSPVAGPSSSKRQTVSGDSKKKKVTAQAEPEEAEPQVVVEEEKAAPPQPPPVEDESVARDVIVVEEDHVEDEHEEEEEEVVVVSTVKEDEHKQVHTEAPYIISGIDSPPDIIDTSDEPAVEEEEEVEEEGNNHEIEFQKVEESHIMDEGAISYDEGDRESGAPQPEGRDEAEEVKPDAEEEEENPNKETLTLNPVEERGHNEVRVVKQQSEAANVRAVALNAQSVGKKESPAAYNDVIEETKNKLMEKRKNKVRALVGAFETVISLQE